MLTSGSNRDWIYAIGNSYGIVAHAYLHVHICICMQCTLDSTIVGVTRVSVCLMFDRFFAVFGR
jgi:hypothetical protein